MTKFLLVETEKAEMKIIKDKINFIFITNLDKISKFKN